MGGLRCSDVTVEQLLVLLLFAGDLLGFSVLKGVLLQFLEVGGTVRNVRANA